MTKNKKETLQEIAYQRILEKIINEKMKPCSPLREEHLAVEFGLSATPVREAFRRLEHEGWLQSFPYRGSFIKEFTKEEIKDLYLLREAIETVAVSETIKNATKKDLAEIEKALDSEKSYIGNLKILQSNTNSYMPTLEPDLDFHYAIVKASHSAMLIHRSDTLRAQLNCMLLACNISNSIEEIEETYEEHSMIYQAITKAWIDIAENLIRKHISKAKAKHLATLANHSNNKK